MTKDIFWEIIARNKHTNKAVMLDNLVAEFTARPIEQVLLFDQYVGWYAQQAMATPSAYIACKVMTHHVSDDSLLYFCLWLVAQGQQLYFATLQHPDALATLPPAAEDNDNTSPEFEMLMGISSLVADTIEEQRHYNISLDLPTVTLSPEQMDTLTADFASRGIGMEWPSEEELERMAPTLAPALWAQYHTPPQVQQQAEAMEALAPLLAGMPTLPAKGESMEHYHEQLTAYLKVKQEKDIQDLHQANWARAQASELGYVETQEWNSRGKEKEIISREGKYGFINKNNQIIVPPIYDHTDGEFSGGLCTVTKNGLKGLINKKGEEVVPVIYRQLKFEGVFSNNLAALQKAERWGFINKKGEEVIACLYEDVSVFCEGVASACLHGKYAVIGPTGELLSDFVSDRCIVYLNGRAQLHCKGKVGLMDEHYHPLIAPKYSQITGFANYMGQANYGYSKVMIWDYNEGRFDNLKEGFIDRQGNEIVPVIYDKIINQGPHQYIGLIAEQETPIDLSQYAMENKKT